jgi:hypothetical protein
MFNFNFNFPQTPDLFLGLSSTAWTGISAIATFAAICFGYYLPQRDSKKKEQKYYDNTLSIVKSDLQTFYSQMKTVHDNEAKMTLDGKPMPEDTKKQVMFGMYARHILDAELIIKCWQENRNVILRNNHDEYKKVDASILQIYNANAYVKNFEAEKDTRQKNFYAVVIEGLAETFVKLAENDAI